MSMNKKGEMQTRATLYYSFVLLSSPPWPIFLKPSLSVSSLRSGSALISQLIQHQSQGSRASCQAPGYEDASTLPCSVL